MGIEEFGLVWKLGLQVEEGGDLGIWVCLEVGTSGLGRWGFRNLGMFGSWDFSFREVGI